MRTKKTIRNVLAIALCGTIGPFILPANSQPTGPYGDGGDCFPRLEPLPGIQMDADDHAKFARELREERRERRLEKWRRSQSLLKIGESSRATAIWEATVKRKYPGANIQVEIAPKQAIELWAKANRLYRSQKYKAVLETIAEVDHLCESKAAAREVLPLKDVTQMKKHAQKMISRKVYGTVLYGLDNSDKVQPGQFSDKGEKTRNIEQQP